MASRTDDAALAPSLASDLATLFKLRIAVFVAVAAFVGALVAPATDFALARACEASVWITLSAAAASAFNQVIERDTDRLMQRTRLRPVAAGRLSARDALLVASLLALAAVLFLCVRFNLVAGLLALGTLFAYVAVYTPLKRHSTLNTRVGAVPGAAPPLLGYAAIAGSVEGWALILFAIVFVWQFPHFMAIAWLYREDYARGGYKMLPVVDPSGRRAGVQAVLSAAALIPVSTIPALAAPGWGGPLYLVIVTLLGLAQLLVAALFLAQMNRESARRLLRMSLIYLPILLGLLVLVPWIK